jgi:hypothetical protein
MVMVVDRQLPHRPGAEQGGIGGIGADILGRARAADMAVEADHPIGRRHDEMQIMGDHEDAAPAPVADAGNEPIKGELAREIHTLDGLVKNQQPRIADKGARQQRPLALAARDILDGPIRQPFGAHLAEGRLDRLGPGGGC